MPNRTSLIGLIFGRFKVISKAKNRIEPSGNIRRMSLCLCLCGEKRIISDTHLKSGHTKSCGCLNSEITSKRNFIHGKSGTRIFEIWQGMIKRCGNPNTKAFKNYGGRGISICKRWMKFENFLNDMGTGKLGWSIERINNDGDYRPQNTCWATMTKQARNNRHNKVLTVRGKTACMSELCEFFGVNYYRVRGRLNLGWKTERAFFEPHNFKD